MKMKYKLSPKGDAALICHPEVGDIWVSKKVIDLLRKGQGESLAFYYIENPEDGGEPFYTVGLKSHSDWEEGIIQMDDTINIIK